MKTDSSISLHSFTPVGDCSLIRFEGRRHNEQFRFTYRIPAQLGEMLDVGRTSKSPGNRRDELWRHNCLEFFVGPTGQPTYWEYNFSFGGDWNCYRFDDYRRGMREEPNAALFHFESRHADGAYLIQLNVSAPPYDTVWLGAPAAVLLLRTNHSELTPHFFAPVHAGDTPDFHHPDSRCIAIE